MEIQSALLKNLLSVKTVQTNLSQFLLGQILTAKVLDRKSPNTAILEINQQRVEVKTNPDRPVQVGEQLKLLVEKQSSPTLLRVLNNERSILLQESKQQLLRLAVPKQASMEKMSALLTQFSNTLKQTNNVLPAPIESQIKKFIQQLPTKENVKTPAGLKTFIKDSGLLLESKLMDEVSNKPKTNNQTQADKQQPVQSQQRPLSPIVQKDLKANLLQVSNVITKHKPGNQKPETTFSKLPQAFPIATIIKKPVLNTKTPVEQFVRANEPNMKLDVETISKQIESAVARIEVNQARIVTTNETQVPVWTIESPIKDNPDHDSLRLEIQPDNTNESDNEKQNGWTVNLKIDFERLGSISAKISLLDKEITASLWSENNTFADLINENLNVLDKQIERAGLTVNKLTCLENGPIEQESLSVDKLVNIKV